LKRWRGGVKEGVFGGERFGEENYSQGVVGEEET